MGQKLYFVQDDDHDWRDGGVDLYIWAESEQQAIDMWWVEASDCDYDRKDEEHYSISATLKPDLPAYVEVPSAAQICEDKRLLRDFGYQIEGDRSCWSCGLYEMDGAFPVCSECDQCSECAAKLEDGEEHCTECAEELEDQPLTEANNGLDDC